MGIFLGAVGVHQFVLGDTKEGLILLGIPVLSRGLGSFATGVIGLVEGIIDLTKTPEEFNDLYLISQQRWF